MRLPPSFASYVTLAVVAVACRPKPDSRASQRPPAPVASPSAEALPAPSVDAGPSATEGTRPDAAPSAAVPSTSQSAAPTAPKAPGPDSPPRAAPTPAPRPKTSPRVVPKSPKKSEASSHPPAAAPKPAARPPTRGAVATGEGFQAWLETTGGYGVGRPGVVNAVVKATAPFHVNAEYPFRFALDAPPKFLSYPSRTIEGASANDQRAILSVPIAPRAAGAAPVTGTVFFSVCTEKRCLVERRQLSVRVVVDPR